MKGKHNQKVDILLQSVSFRLDQQGQKVEEYRVQYSIASDCKELVSNRITIMDGKLLQQNKLNIMDIESEITIQASQNDAQEQDPNNDEDEQNQATSTRPRAGRQPQLPKQLNKAKRTLTKMINEYFINLRQQLLSKPGGKFIYARQHIQTVQNAISKLATIRYTDLQALVPKKCDVLEDFLLSYVSQSKKIIKYNLNICNQNNQKPREVQLLVDQGFTLPDHATPAAFGVNAYFFDGSKFDFTRMVYAPMQINYKINLITGQVSPLQQKPPFYRMKCCIIKVKRGFFIIGGFVGQQKSVTKQCTFYSTQNQSFHQLSSLNLIHNCPSGCVHGEKIYVFSNQGIQYFDQLESQWVVVTMPKRLRCLAFQYCISVSDSQIMIIGGKVCNKNSSDLKIFNTQTGTIDEYVDMLPVGVCCERSWGPMIINNFVTVMSNIQASVYPQVMIKRDAVQMVLIGLGGCFLNTLITS